MYNLINFALNLMEEQNYGRQKFMPSQNPKLNIMQNPDINPDQNPSINSSQNPNINPTQNPHGWKNNQWRLFQRTIIWVYLNEEQRRECNRFLRSL